ncbi:MAG: hypothetical protein V4678_04620 [Patescibacteria group bacterium]
MEPKFSSPELNAPNGERFPETLPQVPNPEAAPEFPLQSPERGQSNPEQTAEQSAQAQAALSAQPIPVTLPTPIAIPTDDMPAVASDDSPAVAADDDLIEKEWVDKAKQIISETHDDPAAREKQVSRLQADYLKKRYGKELGATSE